MDNNNDEQEDVKSKEPKTEVGGIKFVNDSLGADVPVKPGKESEGLGTEGEEDLPDVEKAELASDDDSTSGTGPVYYSSESIGDVNDEDVEAFADIKKTHFEKPAGFWLRLTAFQLDIFVIWVLTLLVVFGIESAFAADSISFDAGLLAVITQLLTRISGPDSSILMCIVFLVTPLVYNVVFLVLKGATPGKMLVCVKVQSASGDVYLSPLRAFIRTVSYIISYLPLLIGFIWVGFNKKKKAWHDVVSGTAVVQYRKAGVLRVLIAYFLPMLPYFILPVMVLKSFSTEPIVMKSIGDAMLGISKVVTGLSGDGVKPEVVKPESLNGAVASAGNIPDSVKVETGVSFDNHTDGVDENVEAFDKSSTVVDNVSDVKDKTVEAVVGGNVRDVTASTLSNNEMFTSDTVTIKSETKKTVDEVVVASEEIVSERTESLVAKIENVSGGSRNGSGVEVGKSLVVPEGGDVVASGTSNSLLLVDNSMVKEADPVGVVLDIEELDSGLATIEEEAFSGVKELEPVVEEALVEVKESVVKEALVEVKESVVKEALVEVKESVVKEALVEVKESVVKEALVEVKESVVKEALVEVKEPVKVENKSETPRQVLVEDFTGIEPEGVSVEACVELLSNIAVNIQPFTSAERVTNRIDLNIEPLVVDKENEVRTGNDGVDVEIAPEILVREDDAEEYELFERDSHDGAVGFVADPDLARKYFKMAKGYYQEGDMLQAEKFFTNAIEVDPDFDEVHIVLGSVYEKQGRVGDAIKEYKKAISVGPYQVKAYIDLGYLYYVGGKKLPAINAVIKAIELDSRNTEAHTLLGVVYQKFDMYDDAVKSYKHALKIDSGLALPHLNMGNIFFEKNEERKAVRSYKSAIKIDPELAEAHNNLGYLYYSIGKNRKAIYEFKKAIELKYEYKRAHKNLSAAYKRAGMDEDATKEEYIAASLP